MGRLYTCDEIAERYRVKVCIVLSWIRKKQICAINISNSKGYRIREEDLLEFEHARRTIPKNK